MWEISPSPTLLLLMDLTLALLACESLESMLWIFYGKKKITVERKKEGREGKTEEERNEEREREGHREGDAVVIDL